MRKIEEFRQLIARPEKPEFWPTDLSDFALWNDEEKGFSAFSRPVLYSSANAKLLEEVKNLIHVAKERWKPSKSDFQSRIRTLENLNKVLTSRYHQERQLRLDAEQQASAYKSAVDSLRSEIQLLSKPRLVSVALK
jgi:hypothetical protein